MPVDSWKQAGSGKSYAGEQIYRLASLKKCSYATRDPFLSQSFLSLGILSGTRHPEKKNCTSQVLRLLPSDIIRASFPYK